jgi:hypothetical protein
VEMGAKTMNPEKRFENAQILVLKAGHGDHP